VMDPVLGDYNAAGDEGRLYVASELVDALRDAIKSGGVTLLTPNAFEAETLSGCPRIVDARGAIAAMDALHAMGARSVVITSSFVASAGGAAHGGGSGHMLVFGSLPWSEVTDECGPGPAPVASMMGGVARRGRLWPAGPSPGTPFARFAVRVPRIPGSFTGTGDLMAALLFAHTSRDSMDGGVGGLVRAVELTLATMAAVCERTERAKARAVAAGRVAAAAAASGVDAATAAKAQSAAAAELRLVESKSAIESPLVRADMQAFALDL
jgi:pyridoxal/pyridoxine/pyridoxamine kinase